MSSNAPIPSSPTRGRAAVRRRRVWIVATLALAWAGACTGGSDEANDDTTVVTDTATDTDPGTATDTTGTTTEGDEAPDSTIDTGDAEPTDEDDAASDGDEPTATTTTEPEATTTTPKPTVQPQDSALACAQVEIGYLRLLNDGTGDDELRTGAQLAQATGKATYEDLGDALAAAIGSDDAADAADALLAQCEADGYERLA